MRSGIILMLIMFSVDCFAKTTVQQKENDIKNTSIVIEVDAQIRPHFMEFLQYCEMTRYAERCKKNLKRLVSVKLKKVLDPKDPDMIGMCSIYDNFREIKLKRNMFPVESLEFKLLVWHELGHCLMDLGHMDDRVHVMNSSMMEKKVILNQWVDIVRDFLYGPPIPSR